jgi:hypothetical protein
MALILMDDSFVTVTWLKMIHIMLSTLTPWRHLKVSLVQLVDTNFFPFV